MSSNTKQILAITLGSLGLVIGIFASVVAYNAKEATQSEAEVTSQVQTEFAAAQARQSALESQQVSDAEDFVAKLSKEDKVLLKSIDDNSNLISKNKKTINSLQSQINGLEEKDKQLSNELASLEKDQQADYNELNKRINQTNDDLDRLRRQVQKLSK